MKLTIWLTGLILILIGFVQIDNVYSEIDMSDLSALSDAYRALYVEYELLGQKFIDLQIVYEELLGDYEVVLDSYEATLVKFTDTKRIADRQTLTIRQLEGEIGSLIVLVEQLKKKKNSLLNIDLSGSIGYDSRLFFIGGGSWQPIEKGWFKMGIFGNFGYWLTEGMGYDFGLQITVSLFG